MSIFPKAQKPSAADNLRSVPGEVRRCYVNVTALRDVVAKIERDLVVTAIGMEIETPDYAHGERTRIFDFANSRVSRLIDGADALSNARAVLAVLEASPEYVAAKAHCEPLLAALDAELAAEQEEAERLAKEERAHREELEKAEEAARNAPSILTARQKLEAVRAKAENFFKSRPR